MNNICLVILQVVALIPLIATVGGFWFLFFKSVISGAFVNYPVRKKDIGEKSDD